MAPLDDEMLETGLDTPELESCVLSTRQATSVLGYMTLDMDNVIVCHWSNVS